MEQQATLITARDQLRLSALLEEEVASCEEAATLETKVRGSTAIDTVKAPRDLVTMNSMIRGVIPQDGGPDPEAVRILTLTYPGRANESEGFISVMSPLGVQLLGARVGDTVTWAERDGATKRMLVDEIIFQPESSGDWHL